jgi:hypothetical protein
MEMEDNPPIHMIITMKLFKNTQDAIELCSVLSMASENANRTVIVHTRYDLPEMRFWSSQKNIVVKKINDSLMCAETPAEKFYQWYISAMEKDPYSALQLSDLMRFCVVYKFGGTYVDTDVIQLKPFSVEGNVVIPEDGNRIGLFL